MAECIECGKFTKFNGGLCVDFYDKKKSQILKPVPLIFLNFPIFNQNLTESGFLLLEKE